GRSWEAHDLGPTEAAAQPAGRGHYGRLATGVVDGLLLVLLAVELDEQAEIGPGEVDAGDELAVVVLDAQLPHRIGQARARAGELHHQRLEQALGRGRSGRTTCHDPSDPGRPRR